MSSTTSLLTALLAVFATSAIILAVLAGSTVCLAVRHRHRRKIGAYAKILAENPSSLILEVLTVGDSLADAPLMRQIRQILTEKRRSEGHNDLG
jgi:hypothetical protein